MLKRRGLSMSALAAELKVSRASLYQMLSGGWESPRPGKVSKNSPARQRLEQWLKGA